MSSTVRVLLQAAMELSPTSVEQQAFTSLVHEMQREGEEEADVVITLLGLLLDGLRYGNWPKSESVVTKE